jgi:vacuolar-type H+-ATPase subunit D/Vma8
MFDPSLQPKSSPGFKKSKIKSEESSVPEQPMEQTIKGSKISDQDLKAQLEMAKNHHKLIEQQLEAFLMKSGLSKEMIKTLLDNPNNFTDAGWKILKAKRDHLTKKVWDQISGEEAATIKAKQKSKAASAQKGKTLGARKKWLPMQ